VAAGSILAARYVTLRNSVRVIPLGIAMGLVVISMIFVNNKSVAVALLVLVGALAGFFVVPMNALLQHRGHILMGAGHSIAVQNFNENLSILVMIGAYALLMWLGLSIDTLIVLFGLFVAGTMLLVKRRHEANQRENDNTVLLDDHSH
jgi:beta-lactamase regulating signal transducer with metallopeptidase domain